MDQVTENGNKRLMERQKAANGNDDDARRVATALMLSSISTAENYYQSELARLLDVWKEGPPDWVDSETFLRTQRFVIGCMARAMMLLGCTLLEREGVCEELDKEEEILRCCVHWLKTRVKMTYSRLADRTGYSERRLREVIALGGSLPILCAALRVLSTEATKSLHKRAA